MVRGCHEAYQGLHIVAVTSVSLLPDQIDNRHGRILYTTVGGVAAGRGGTAMFSGGLFTDCVLRDGIRDTDADRTLDTGTVAALWNQMADDRIRFTRIPRPREAETESFRTRDLVLRMMAALEAGRPDARVEG